MPADKLRSLLDVYAPSEVMLSSHHAMVNNADCREQLAKSSMILIGTRADRYHRILSVPAAVKLAGLQFDALHAINRHRITTSEEQTEGRVGRNAAFLVRVSQFLESR